MADKAITTTKTKPHKQSPESAPPAYFLSLTLTNFRCFGPEQMLDLSDGEGRPTQWTVILGDNGVGKTTLLQSLAAMQPFEKAETPGLLRPKLFEFENFRAEIFSQSVRGYWQVAVDIWYGQKLSGKGVGNKFHFMIARSQPHTKSQSKYAAIANLPMKEDKQISGLICFGYGASRISGSTSLAESTEHDTCASLFNDNATLINAEEWLLQADYSASKPSKNQQKAKERRDQIKDVLINLLPDVTDIRISQAKTGFSSFVEVETPYGWVSIQGLSLGYRTLISWMVDFACRLFERYPDSKNPLAEPAICLVDEIDLHLHPRWQRNLMSFLSERFPNTQFIATAHSPLVVQAAQDANIVVLRREGDHVVIDNDVEAIKNWRVDQILTSDLFGLETARPPQLDEAMKERNKILGKARLTKKDQARLKALEAQIGELPTGETPEDIEAMDIIRRAAELLKNGKNAAP